MEFENTSELTLPEANDTLDDLLFVTTSIPFEFSTLPVLVEVVSGAATRGMSTGTHSLRSLMLVSWQWSL